MPEKNSMKVGRLVKTGMYHLFPFYVALVNKLEKPHLNALKAYLFS